MKAMILAALFASTALAGDIWTSRHPGGYWRSGGTNGSGLEFYTWVPFATKNSTVTNRLEVIEITKPCPVSGCPGQMKWSEEVSVVATDLVRGEGSWFLTDGWNNSELGEILHMRLYSNTNVIKSIRIKGTNVFETRGRLTRPTTNPVALQLIRSAPSPHSCSVCTNVAWYPEKFPRFETNKVAL